MLRGKRVAITGLGTKNPLGNTVKESWENLKAGKSGIGPLTRFNPDDHRCGQDFPRIAGEVKEFDLTQLLRLEDLELVGLDARFVRTATEFAEGMGIGKSEIRKMPLVLQYVIAAVIEALKDSQLNLSREKAWERGVAIGSGMGGGREFEIGVGALVKDGLKKIPPRTIIQILINMVSGEIARYTGSEGPSDAVTSACATGAHNIARGAEYIRNGQAKIVIAGATEASIIPFGMGIFERIGALSKGRLGPERSSRPFDIQRDGFAIAEGAGILILEEWNRAEKRGARIYGEVAGWASTSDAFHETEGNPLTQRRAMDQALKMAGLRLGDMERLYINAHATSTFKGDAIEASAIKAFLGKWAEKGIVASRKGQLGHCLGAAAAIETIFALKEMEEGIILPNFNLEQADPACQGLFLPVQRVNCKIEYFLKNAFGFGGQNSCLVVRQPT
ncbi:MAG: beta-ketoacyl synthase N-terminal-like domain-containing protein [bacterium]|nr:beta-ketoacyl synthase N-terminal-like domain-containing protein [bacterium]